MAALVLAGCASYYEIPIETPIKPKLDVSSFERVLIAGFITGGTDDVDGNLETTRLLRSQLRNRSELRVIDADTLPLMDVAAEDIAAAAAPVDTPQPAANTGQQAAGQAGAIRDEKDLEPYEHLFADVEYWKRIGEEYQNPLIVTGTVMFTPASRSGFVQREQEVYDAVGRRRVVPVRTYMERKGFRLKPKFIFIDGRTGTTLYSETFTEEVLYPANQSTPALSSYFELMDRLLPSFLSTLSSQKIKGTRVLLQ
ncbi:MAG: hypothetical protein AB7P99_11375 [Vicinamibacterales bacterium]